MMVIRKPSPCRETHLNTEEESTMHSLGTAPQAETLVKTNFDEDGYLLDPELWDQDMGRAIALQEGVGALGERHWRVIDDIRERYFTLGGVPNLRRICRATSLSKFEVYELFGSCLVIWRIAGLPNPGEEVKAYLN
jgi:tRNA 2-thiouridine synthesizing protein E